MTNTTKRIMTGFLVSIVIFILIMTWFYPYSFFSVHKSYSYTPDPVIVDGYINDLTEFKSSYEKALEGLTTDKTIDLTIDRTQYVLPLFEQEWLISKDPVNMKKEDLSNILFEVKNTRNTLLNLVARGDYSSEQRQYLVDSIESLLLLEESIAEIKSGKAESRRTLKTQFHNVYGDFIGNFMMFEIFYERSQNE
ncbi:hypothetical protein CIL05_15005 [Virgibacillus profundi]|uniref:Uncharacterized protein n=1 Tax=Virgibacillus profundi TaxID=2024555 RepID=A0A2A2IBE1_9BACI|nr:hypothetical protein [Virgibacillus profundi]PAV28604.1 hypothetical protein CIL05_15005 [Virgibacillus profundi]PXY52772.1 hypothetical protein CIT14_15130 [Virgibacillus profundi]